MGVVCAQQPLEIELLQRCQQLQSRLSTLKIENEEVRHRSVSFFFFLPNHLVALLLTSPLPLLSIR